MKKNAKGEKMKKTKIKPPANLAGFGIRAAAFVIDLFIFWWVFFFIRLAINIRVPPIALLWAIATWCIYYTALVLFFGNTIGKKILGLKIVSATEKPITAVRIALRAFFLITFDWLIFGAGFLLILVNKNKQGLHDKVAKTYVVKVKK